MASAPTQKVPAYLFVSCIRKLVLCRVFVPCVRAVCSCCAFLLLAEPRCVAGRRAKEESSKAPAPLSLSVHSQGPEPCCARVSVCVSHRVGGWQERLNDLRDEAKRLKVVLSKYEEAFVAEHGRKMKSQSEIEPIKKEYARFKAPHASRMMFLLCLMPTVVVASTESVESFAICVLSFVVGDVRQSKRSCRHWAPRPTDPSRRLLPPCSHDTACEHEAGP